MKYQIYQIQYTDADVEAINSGRPNAKRQYRTEMDFDFRGENIAENAAEAFTLDLYTNVAIIEAADLEHVFQISNIGNEEHRIERLTRMASISVGDIIIDENNIVWVVAPFGFKEVHELEEVA
jgi:hypothetical protein